MHLTHTLLNTWVSRQVKTLKTYGNRLVFFCFWFFFLSATFNSNFSYIPTSKVKVDLLGGRKKKPWKIFNECIIGHTGSPMGKKATAHRSLYKFHLNFKKRKQTAHFSFVGLSLNTETEPKHYTYTSVNQNLKWIKQHRTTSTRTSLYWFSVINNVKLDLDTLSCFLMVVFFKGKDYTRVSRFTKETTAITAKKKKKELWKEESELWKGVHRKLNAC